MNDLPLAWRALVLVGAVAVIGGTIIFYVRKVREITNSNLPPEERKKWLRRVMLLRGMGWIQWEQYRRKHGVTSRGQHPEDEGLNSAPPPGSD
jgi:hypothetical protein